MGGEEHLRRHDDLSQKGLRLPGFPDDILTPQPSNEGGPGSRYIGLAVRRSVGILEFRSQCGDTGKAEGAVEKRNIQSFLA